MNARDFSAVLNHQEGRKFACVLMLVGMAVEISRIVRDTYFITTVGANAIPIAYVLFASFMALSSYLYALASNRVSLRSLVRFVLLFAFGVLLIEYALLSFDFESPLLAYALFCTVEMIFLFVPMTVWALANEVFHRGDDARHLPRLAAYGLFGTVLGGVSARLTVEEIGVHNLLVLSCVALFAGGVIIRKVARTEVQTVPQFETSFRRSLQEPLVKTLVLLAVPMWVLVYMIEYTYFHTMETVFPSEESLAAFLSTFVAFSSLVALIVQVLLTPLLTRTLGIPRTATVYPIMLGIAAVLTLIYSLTPVRAHQANTITFAVGLVLLARLLDLALFQSIYDSTVQLLYYAVPDSTRTAARALVSGIVFPLSIACAGLLLLFFNSQHEPIHNIAFCSVSIGFLVVVMAMDVRPDYLRSFIAHWQSSDAERTEDLRREVEQLSENEAEYVLKAVLDQFEEGAQSAKVAQLGLLFPDQLIQQMHTSVEPELIE